MFLFFCFCTFIPVPFSSLSLSFFFSSTISSICFLPFSGKRHKMTHKDRGVVKPKLNQSRQKANKNYISIAPLSDNGAILDLPCPSVIPSFRHSLPHSFLLSIILFILIRYIFVFLKNCKVTKLYLCTHIPSGLMYGVYRNPGQRPITLGVT